MLNGGFQKLALLKVASKHLLISYSLQLITISSKNLMDQYEIFL